MLTNIRHERFAQAVAKGTPLEHAYTNAGYRARGNAARANASRLLTNANVAARLQELTERLAKPAIADADEIQQFLTSVMRGEDENKQALTDDHVTKDGFVVPIRVAFRDRLKAAELLARARGVFSSTQVGAEGELEAIRRALVGDSPTVN